ncbi:hypothetical protein HYT24_03275 [Candidatus Pacearchaeota archaeon]|nr:hypothetical protein [Candidatus Pacearchaeota archaeon]
MEKKVVGLFAIIGVFLLVSGVYAVSDSEIDDFLRNVAEQKGISESSINNITEVDFNNLPRGINISNIDDTNLAIYKIETNDSEPAFILTVSSENVRKISAPKYYTTSLLNFGYDEETKDSTFLKTSTGVSTSKENGYVMLRDGSITGMSTSLEITSGAGEVQIIILKNGETVGFGNSFAVTSPGIKTDRDIQSQGVVAFEAGDAISVYAKVSGDVKWKDAINIVEITN